MLAAFFPTSRALLVGRQAGYGMLWVAYGCSGGSFFPVVCSSSLHHAKCADFGAGGLGPRQHRAVQPQSITARNISRTDRHPVGAPAPRTCPARAASSLSRCSRPRPYRSARYRSANGAVDMACNMLPCVFAPLGLHPGPAGRSAEMHRLGAHETEPTGHIATVELADAGRGRAIQLGIAITNAMGSPLRHGHRGPLFPSAMRAVFGLVAELSVIARLRASGIIGAISSQG
jgi:hypothetical protein